MSKFRKKPVVVEAVQLSLEDPSRAVEFVGDAGYQLFSDTMGVRAPEGMTWARDGDWIIRTTGGHYVCPRAAFEASYEPVPEES